MEQAAQPAGSDEPGELQRLLQRGQGDPREPVDQVEDVAVQELDDAPAMEEDDEAYLQVAALPNHGDEDEQPPNRDEDEQPPNLFHVPAEDQQQHPAVLFHLEGDPHIVMVSQTFHSILSNTPSFQCMVTTIVLAGLIALLRSLAELLGSLQF